MTVDPTSVPVVVPDGGSPGAPATATCWPNIVDDVFVVSGVPGDRLDPPSSDVDDMVSDRSAS